MFITKRKEIFTSLNEPVLEEGQEPVKLSTALMSEGMIVFWVISAILILFTTIVG